MIDAVALYSVVARMLCRLTPPLCLNFLGLMHLDSHIIADTGIVETSYTKVSALTSIAVVLVSVIVMACAVATRQAVV